MEQLLIQKIRLRESDSGRAFEKLIRLARAWDLGMCVATPIFGDRDAAQDVVNGALFKAYEKFSTFRGDDAIAFRKWFARIVQNASFDAKSDPRSKNTERLPDDDEHRDKMLSKVHHDPSPHEAEQAEAALADRMVALTECVDRLTARQREFYVRRYRDNINTTELAEALQVASGTVRATLHQVRDLLRECLRLKGVL